jgi:hypothetical protein
MIMDLSVSYQYIDKNFKEGKLISLQPYGAQRVLEG